ncbi:hypothetical protein [Escherichia coli]
MSQYPELIAQFSSGNQTRIKQGLYIIVLRLNIVAEFTILII